MKQETTDETIKSRFKEFDRELLLDIETEVSFAWAGLCEGAFQLSDLINIQKVVEDAIDKYKEQTNSVS